MDEAMLKSGQYPNIAIEAGSDPAEVMREHGQAIPDGEKHEPDTRHMDNDVYVHMCPNDTGAHSNVSKNLSDSREKLETDIMFEYLEFPGDQNRIFAYLDRQAAITERECMSRDTSERVGWDCAECAEGLGKELDARCDPLKERIAELTAELENCRKYAEQGERMKPQSKENGDTREKLEADIRAWCRDAPFATKPSVQTLLGLLDRQAAITEREIYKREQFHEKTRDMFEQIETQGIEIDSLIAERDGLRRALETQEHLAGRASRDYLRVLDRADKLQEQVNSLTAKCDRLSRDLDAEHALVVQFEHDNEELRHANNTLRSSVAGLKMTVERFKARESREPADVGN